MRKEDWKDFIKKSIGDEETLDLIAENLKISDDAKQELRNKGYGYTGLNILETAKLVPDEN